MDNIRTVYLAPIDGRKSFYGKCFAVGNVDIGYTLMSYGTPIMWSDGFQFVRLWNGYSATTMRHVNSFVNWCGYDMGGKAWWDSLPVGSV